MKNNTKRYILFILISIILLVIAFIFSIRVGSIKMSVGEIFDVITGNADPDGVNYTIIKNIRLPRAILGILVGSSLAISGALLQAVMQNPLADPGVIGVSSGASLVAIIILILFPRLTYMLPLFAFLGGIFATVMVYSLAWRNGIKPVRLVLSGVAINALLGGGTSLLNILYSDKIQSVIQWTNGSLAGRNWTDVKLLFIYAIVGIIISLFFIRSANTMLLGDDKATNLGLNVNRSRILMSLLGAYLASISTAFVGVIGFVGLVIPHMSRLLVGSDYKILLPFSIINGGTFLLVADTFARTVASPLELPVGTLMSVIGAPFFLFLLRKEKI